MTIMRGNTILMWHKGQTKIIASWEGLLPQLQIEQGSLISTKQTDKEKMEQKTNKQTNKQTNRKREIIVIPISFV